MRATCVLLNWNRPDNLDPIIRNLPDVVDELIVWDNADSQREWTATSERRWRVQIVRSHKNLCTLARFIAATMARNELVLTQDDDCLPEWGPLLKAVNAQPDRITSYLATQHYKQANQIYQHAHGWETLLGWGGAFQRWMIEPLVEFSRRFPHERETVRRKADRIFAICQGRPHHWIRAEINHLHGAWTRGSLFRQPDHRRLNHHAYDLCGTFLHERETD